MDEEKHADAALSGHKALDQTGECGFTKGANGQTGEGDADLNTGDNAVEIAK
jgi:hypothetical protein